MVDRKASLNRRCFLELSGATVAAATVTTEAFAGEFAEAKFAPEELARAVQGRRVLQAQCPYCGVGCGTLIQVENDRIVGVSPDKLHPTNKGVQCIKGLNAHEPTYRDRLTKVLIRKDMSDPAKGHVSATKGRFDDDVFREASYEEAEELVADRIASYVKEFGGNCIGLSGSGQLTMEAQWIENLLMKGVIGSNSIEANARMCMTSAVTGYFASYGSDTPPTSYDDVEQADFISFWGHNAREAHPVLFWRVADHKKRKDIPTLVRNVVSAIRDLNRNQVIVAGIETHVCVYQSCRQLLEEGFDVTLAEDCTSSRHKNDRNIAVLAMRDAGVKIATVEMLLFELMHVAGGEKFKQISNLVK